MEPQSSPQQVLPYTCPQCGGTMIHASHLPKQRKADIYVCLNCEHEEADATLLVRLNQSEEN